MLTRFDEEIRQGSGTLDAVWVALSRAGRVVFVSGVTLGLTNGERTPRFSSEQSRRSDADSACKRAFGCWSAAGLTFCSVDVVSSIGWGGAVSCAVAVAVHLTLLPALLVVSGRCCGDAGRALRWRP